MTFDHLFAAAQEPAFLLDPLEDRFVAGNPAGCTMLGYTRDELLETPISRIHPGELPQLHDFVARVLHDGSGTTIDPHLPNALGHVSADGNGAPGIRDRRPRLCCRAHPRPKRTPLPTPAG